MIAVTLVAIYMVSGMPVGLQYPADKQEDDVIVLSQFDNKDQSRRFIIRPNKPMSWRQNLLFVYSIGFISGAMALYFLYHGAWMVVPFVGLEILVLTVCLYYVYCRMDTQEVVTVDTKRVVIESGRHAVRQRNVFNRYWARVELHPPSHQWYASRLFIGSHGRQIEIGAALVEDERKKLARELAEIIQS